MMHFENYHSENDCSGCCSECILTTQFHCKHCPQYGRVGGVRIPEGYDYSHLVGNPAKHDGKMPDTKRFDELLSGYDQRLLSDMHILWRCRPWMPVAPELMAIQQQSSRTRANFEPPSQMNKVADSVIEFRLALRLTR